MNDSVLLLVRVLRTPRILRMHRAYLEPANSRFELSFKSLRHFSNPRDPCLNTLLAAGHLRGGGPVMMIVVQESPRLNNRGQACIWQAGMTASKHPSLERAASRTVSFLSGKVNRFYHVLVKRNSLARGS